MTQIKIGFSRPKKWKPFAALIMFGYGIQYDHVFLEIYSSKYQRSLIYQASGSKVNFMGNDLFHEENEVVDSFYVEIIEDRYNDMMRFAIDNSGRSYGIKQALGMAVVRAAEILGIQITNPFKDGEQTFVCSELGAYVLTQFGGLNFNKNEDDITPKDLYTYFQNLKAPNG